MASFATRTLCERFTPSTMLFAAELNLRMRESMKCSKRRPGPTGSRIGTSNLQLSALVARFQTRLQQFKVEPPDTDSILSFLRQWPLKEFQARQAAVGCAGNVRAALLDAQSFLDAAAIA
jgi:hypothetical protein